MDNASATETVRLADVALAPSRKQLCEIAARIFHRRRQRLAIMDAKYLGEPGWDMLLALYCVPARRLVLDGALASAAKIPLSTGQRWQKQLIEDGLIESVRLNYDSRERLMRLSKKGRALMDAYFAQILMCESESAAKA